MGDGNLHRRASNTAAITNKLELEVWRPMWNILRRTEYHGSDQQALNEHTFQTLLRLEWKRSNRSHRRFVLMLLEPSNPDIVSGMAMSKVLGVLPNSTRETDIVGWYKDGAVIGVIFTEIGEAADTIIRSALLAKISKILHNTLSNEQANRVRVSFQLFPISAATDDTSIAARYRDLAPTLRYKQSPSSNEVLALKATTSS